MANNPKTGMKVAGEGPQSQCTRNQSLRRITEGRETKGRQGKERATQGEEQHQATGEGWQEESSPN